MRFLTYEYTHEYTQRSDKHKVEWQRSEIYTTAIEYIDGLVQDCSISSALAMELLQSCTKPSIFKYSKSTHQARCLFNPFVYSAKQANNCWLKREYLMIMQYAILATAKYLYQITKPCLHILHM